MEFLGATLRRWLLQHEAAQVDQAFALAVVLGDTIRSQDESEPTDDSPTAYLTLDPTSSACCVIEPTLRRLAGLHPQLPVTFYRRLQRSLAPLIRVYDYQDAAEYVEMLRGCYGEDEAIDLPDVAGAVPRYMQARPLGSRRVRQVTATARNPKIRAPLQALEAVEAAAAPLANLPPLTPDELRDLESCDPWLPCLLIVFKEQDAIEGCFESEMQSVEAGNQIPTAILAMRVAEPASVRLAFERLGQFYRLFAALARLLKAMPPPDGTQRR